MKKIPIKAMLISVWMYFGGPLVWGAWMVWRLNTLELSQWCALLYPTGVLVLLFFFAANLLNLKSRKVSAPVHCLLVAGFGTVGTFAFMALPALLGVEGPWLDDAAWKDKIVLGTLSGGSLTGMFYPLFSIGIFSNIEEFRKNRKFLVRFNLVAYIWGLLAFVTVAFLSALFSSFNVLKVLFFLFPVLMSGLMFRKAKNSIPQENSEVYAEK
jgi:hypothetical protein